MTKEVAEDWLTRKLKELSLPEALNIYHKGEEFQGILFASFQSPEATSKVIEVFNRNKPKVGGKDVRSKKDLPIEIRTPISFLLGLRYQLNRWGFSKKEVKVNEFTRTMGVGDVPVLNVEVRDHKLELTWLDVAWEKWNELQASPEMSEMIRTANEKLQQSAKEVNR